MPQEERLQKDDILYSTGERYSSYYDEHYEYPWYEFECHFPSKYKQKEEEYDQWQDDAWGTYDIPEEDQNPENRDTIIATEDTNYTESLNELNTRMSPPEPPSGIATQSEGEDRLLFRGESWEDGDQNPL